MIQPFRILHEDASVIVIEKAPGTLSQGGRDGDADLCRLLGMHSRCAVYAVHRLDRGVGGVMVFAKTKQAAAFLSSSLADHACFVKEYLAVVGGIPECEEGELFDFLLHDERKRRSAVVPRGTAGAKEARLSYRMLEHVEQGGKHYSLLAVRLFTGRTHQIRVQFSSRRLPLAGDGRYGAHDRFPGIALYASRLTFPHPDTGEAVCFELPSPETPPFSLFVARSISSSL